MNRSGDDYEMSLESATPEDDPPYPFGRCALCGEYTLRPIDQDYVAFQHEHIQSDGMFLEPVSNLPGWRFLHRHCLPSWFEGMFDSIRIRRADP